MQSKQSHSYSLSHKSSKSECIKNTFQDINYSIRCINCDSFIPRADVDQHSLLCQFYLSTQSSQIKDQTNIEEIDIKIKKLRQSIIIQSKKETNVNNKKYLMRAEELCIQLMKLQNIDEKEYRKVLDISEEIKMITESYKGILLIQLFLESLNSLAQVKLQNMKFLGLRKYQLINNQKQEDINKQSYKHFSHSDQQNQIEQTYGYLFSTNSNYLRQDVLLRKTQVTKMSWDSLKKSQLDTKVEILTQISNTQCNEEIQESNEIQNSHHDNQKLFYQKCLNFKAQLFNNDPAQKVPLCVLYKEVINKRIPINQWNQFIESALNKPSQYLDLKKLTLLNQTNNIQNSIKQFTINSNFQERLKCLKQI